ncbi:MAG: efflux RND transporter permease subunit, partial [Candidatus Sumerlaeota bacterium]
YVRSAINGVRNAALMAAVLLIVVVYLFLGSFRQVFVLLLALPLTIIFNFGLMKLAGFSLNIFSLGGLVVVLGVVLDNAIIVMESITRHRHDRPEASAADHAIEGSSVVGAAIVAATLSFVALFMPFLMVEGLISMLFRELILVMAGIVAISLTLAITLVPMLTAILFGGSRSKIKSRFIIVFDQFAEKYARFLGGVVRMRWFVLAGFALFFATGIGLFGRVGGEFLPPIDDGRVMVKVKMPTGTALAETNRVLRRVEALIADDPLIESRFVLAGGQARALNTYEISNEGQVDIQLVPRDQRDTGTADYVARLRPMLAKAGVPGARIMASQKRLRGIKGLSQADIQIKLRGQETETLFSLAQRTTEAMRGLEYFTNVYVSMDMTKPEYRVRVDRVKAAELGISVSDVASALRSLITGAVPTRYLDDGEYYDIRVLVPEKDIVSRQDLENLPLAALNGGFLRLRDVASIEQSVGPVEIARENQAKQVTVQADVVGVSVAQAREQLTAVLSDLDRPVGYDYSYGGQAELMADMRKSVIAVIGFAVFFAFIVLSVQFNSWKLPALVLGSVPISLAGAVFALYLTGLSFGATVVIGILVVIAATVNDGVLLFTLAGEIEEAEGKTPEQSIRDSARIRLRTRLMTTMTTMAGFLPLALNLEQGGDMLQPMAVAAIGGLALEMPVALFFMPCLYVLFARRKKQSVAI